MAKRYRLKYLGGFGMGLKYGETCEVDEKKAEDLLRYWPQHFTVVEVHETQQNKRAKIRDKKTKDE